MNERELETDSSAGPLAPLHRMSVTAGVASQQYRAVNSLAVVTALLGAASLLVLMSWNLLPIPAAGLICGIVAWRQIARSNGTQTGKPLVILGLLVCLVLGGAAAAYAAASAARTRADQRRVSAVIDDLGQSIRRGDYASAYKLFDEPFRQRITMDHFVYNLTAAQSDKHFGPLVSMSWNQAAPQYVTIEAGEVALRTQVIMRFKIGQDEFPIQFRRVGADLLIDDLSFLFPPSR